MAAWPGLSLNCAACWGWRDVGRTTTPCAAYLVRHAFIVEMEGQVMKTPDPTKAESSAPNSANFTGTDNPRHLRTITVLLRRPVSRQELDTVAGASNSPELVAELRRRGLDVPCERINFIDRDGYPCRPGVYSLSNADRRKVRQWQTKQDIQRRG